MLETLIGSHIVKFAVVSLNDARGPDEFVAMSEGFASTLGVNTGDRVSQRLTASEYERLSRGTRDERQGRVRIELGEASSPIWLEFEHVDGEQVMLRLGSSADVSVLEGEAESLHTLMKTTLDMLPSPVFVKDRDHRWVLTNKAFDALFGITESPIGKSDYDFFPREEADHFWAKDEEVIAQNRESIVEEPVTTLSGELRWMLTHKIPAQFADEEPGLVGVITDITQRKASQERLLLNAQLRYQAIKANHTKSKLMANMSHKLRTPLNTIIGYTEMILEEEETEHTRELRADLHPVLESSYQLRGLIDDVLDISRMDAGKMLLSPEPLALDELVREAIGRATSTLDTTQVGLEIDLPGRVDVTMDRRRIDQIVSNLCANAVRHTTSGQITVRLAERGEDVELTIEDTGVGIAPERLANLFVPFDRLSRHDMATTQRLGLGLTMVRYLCRIMGGDVHAQSVVGRGSTFTVRLPRDLSELREPPAASLDAMEASSLESEARGWILVIDEDLAFYELLQQFSANSKVSMLWASSAEQGLEYARSHKPTMIVVDANMKGAKELLEHLDESSESETTRVIVGAAGVGDAGAATLSKPVTRTSWEPILRGITE